MQPDFAALNSFKASAFNEKMQTNLKEKPFSVTGTPGPLCWLGASLSADLMMEGGLRTAHKETATAVTPGLVEGRPRWATRQPEVPLLTPAPG